jgi:1-acyl-sn-glycerol-3-phosphate acyltransferase
VTTTGRVRHFIQVWNESDNVKEVARKLGVPYHRRLSVRACHLRKQGYQLIRFPPGTLSPDKSANRKRR